jgi:hypothetical protein
LNTSCVLGLRPFTLFNDMTLFIKKKESVLILKSTILPLPIDFFILVVKYIFVVQLSTKKVFPGSQLNN